MSSAKYEAQLGEMDAVRVIITNNDDGKDFLKRNNLIMLSYTFSFVFCMWKSFCSFSLRLQIYEVFIINVFYCYAFRGVVCVCE